MDEHIFIGTHIISEMYGVSDHLINDQSLILKILLRGVKLCGAKCVSNFYHLVFLLFCF